MVRTCSSVSIRGKLMERLNVFFKTTQLLCMFCRSLFLPMHCALVPKLYIFLPVTCFHVTLYVYNEENIIVCS